MGHRTLQELPLLPHCVFLSRTDCKKSTLNVIQLDPVIFFSLSDDGDGSGKLKLSHFLERTSIKIPPPKHGFLCFHQDLFSRGLAFVEALAFHAKDGSGGESEQMARHAQPFFSKLNMGQGFQKPGSGFLREASTKKWLKEPAWMLGVFYFSI